MNRELQAYIEEDFEEYLKNFNPEEKESYTIDEEGFAAFAVDCILECREDKRFSKEQIIQRAEEYAKINSRAYIEMLEDLECIFDPE